MRSEKKKFYLGIDLGTSAAKGIVRDCEGVSFKAKQSYSEETPSGWLRAVKALIAELKKDLPGEIAAVSFSSQVGTYVVDGKDVLSWRAGIGREELDEIKSAISDEEFAASIGMRHPDLISYPLPRLLHIQRHCGAEVQVLMPKELPRLKIC